MIFTAASASNVVLVVDTLIICLLAILVVGLLRSHAALLHRTSANTPAPPRQVDRGPGPGIAGLPSPRPEATAAFDVAGPTPRGGHDKISAKGRRNTVFAFLTSGCTSCKPFWEGISDIKELPGDARLVIVTKDSAYESPTKLRALAPEGTRIVMSTKAWQDYQVDMAPYFVYVDGPSGSVQSDGSALSWPQVISLLSDAIAEYEDQRIG